MGNISNKALVGLLVVAIAVSLVGTFISLNKIGKISTLTGMAQQDTGTVSLNVQQLAVVNVSTASIDFGNITVPSGSLSCYAETHDGNGTCYGVGGTWDNGTANTGFVFENIGNVNINVTVSVGDIPSTFIGGSQDGGPEFKWKCRTKSGTGTPVLASYTASSQSATNCYENMSYSTSPGEDEGYLDVYIKVPADAGQGSKTNAVTFAAVPVS